MTRASAPRPTVSVIITTYYRNERLRDAIESVLAQEHAPAEVIVVDGSEEAVARPVAADYPVAYLAHADDRGAQAARNAGAVRASGEYVQFLDDDDRLHPRKFAAQVPLFSDGVGVVYCGIDDADFGVARPDPAVRGDVLERALAMNTLPCIPSTMLIDRSVLEEMLPLSHRHGADDIGMKIELARRTQFDYVDQPLVARGRTDGALSRSWAHVAGRKLLLAMYADLYETVPDAVYREAATQTHYREGRKHLEEDVWSPAAIVALARACYHAPSDRAAYLRACVASVFGRPGVRVADKVFG